MKKNNIIKLFTIAIATLGLASCNDYLDKLPDDRAEVNTVDKVTSLNTSAYLSTSNNLMMEESSDNVYDNGKSYGSTVMIEEIYQWKDVETEGNDSPRQFWNGVYEAVATANQSLQSANEIGADQLKPQIAEAKLCRAYAMFQAACCFCMAWNPEKADEYLGLPYPTEPEKNLNTTYTRGTLRELYEAINKDIEEALPDVDDNIYTQPSYHFNRRAAYAFAARFNLYYMNYEKAAQYASTALGSDPTSVMRDYSKYNSLGRTDYANLWIRSSESCNLMFVNAYSMMGALQYGLYTRFGHNSTIASYETYWPSAPWGSGSSYNCLYYSHKLYGNNQCVSFPKSDLQFEYTDRNAGIGYYRLVDPVFTGDETILVRAEAYTMMHQFDNALADINTWVSTHCDQNYEYAEEDGSKTPVECPTITLKVLEDFYNALDYSPVTPSYNGERTIKKEFHPQGFTIDAGTYVKNKKGEDVYQCSDQEDLLQFILHMRRLETMFQGMRFYDIKRYGISFSHNYSGKESIVFKAGDLRGAIQLPQDVIAAGLEANPREAETTTDNE